MALSTEPMVKALFIGPIPREPMQAAEHLVAVAGHGLEGDRKFRREGRPPARNGPDREITLIEAEAIEAVNRDCGVEIASIETRRNIVTHGVALNHLVGKRFRVGAVVLEGLRLCEPCEHLESLLDRPGVREALLHRGGLRARIVEGGEIHLGDSIQPVESS